MKKSHTVDGSALVDELGRTDTMPVARATGTIPNALFDRMLLDEARILPPEEVAVIAADYARDPFKEWDAPIVRDLLATCEYLQAIANATPTTPASTTLETSPGSADAAGISPQKDGQ